MFNIAQPISRISPHNSKAGFDQVFRRVASTRTNIAVIYPSEAMVVLVLFIVLAIVAAVGFRDEEVRAV